MLSIQSSTATVDDPNNIPMLILLIIKKVTLVCFIKTVLVL